ncbi:UNVERIFIED_CONTAM: hypothetical protein FKN15_016241 [Acipenser sinensis]
MMAAAPIQQNGNHTGVPIDLDPPDSRKRPLEAPPEAGSTKRTNTGVPSNTTCMRSTACCSVIKFADQKLNLENTT